MDQNAFYSTKIYSHWDSILERISPQVYERYLCRYKESCFTQDGVTEQDWKELVRYLQSSTQYGIFVHIPKTGGTSVFSSIWKHERTMPNFHLWKSHNSALLRQEKLHAILTPRDAEKYWQAAFKFTFIRNPWDQLVSWYHQGLKDNQYSCGFEAWILDGMPTPHARNDLVPGSDTRDHRNQLAYFTDLDGKILVDFVGRYENLNKDFDTVCRKMGLYFELEHTNRSMHRRPYQEYYDATTKQIVQDRFGDFIEQFGYKF